ncbi:MAG: aminoacyl-tRNA hydrolase [Polyangiales bacterium]
MKLVVGLGNPGTKYARNRHNVGFMVVDQLARQFGFPELKEKFNGVWAKGSIAGEDVALLEPMTFMNESGRSVQAAVGFLKVAMKDIVVLHDELDIPFSDVRLKVGGGHAGHNGLRSIISVIGAEFARVRIGIGRPPAGFRGEVADFVLQNFDPVEAASVGDLIQKSVDVTKGWIEKGPLAANEANARPGSRPNAKKSA